MNTVKLAALGSCALLLVLCSATEAQSAPAPTLSLTWGGMDRDVVGRWKDPGSNKQPDGRFSAHLETHGVRRVVSYMVLQTVNKAGKPAGGQVWDTRPGGFWILGVYRGARRLNPVDRNIRDVVRGGARYEIFGNDSGWFKPGRRFRLMLQFAGGGQAEAFATIGAAPAPTPPEPHAGPTLSASWGGLGRDVVGRWKDPGANKQPDGHFTVQLQTHGARKVVNYIVLHSATPQGKPIGGQVWDTRPGGYWILGVYRGGRRLNPVDRNISDVVRGGARYEIYGNDSGWFKPGKHFRVTVKFAGGGEAVAIAAIGGAPPPTPPTHAGRLTLRASWGGKARDVVGRGSDPGANKQPDGRFIVHLETHGARKVVTYIVVHSANSAGKPAGGQVWDTRPGRFWILGVYREGRRLNPVDRNIRDVAQGAARYELYGNDSGWFKPGQTFRVTLKFADGGEAVALTRVPR